MRARLVLLPVLVAGLVLSLSGAEAATKALDGKKVKSLAWTVVGAPQDNDPSLATDQLPGGDSERVHCAPPRCAILPFGYVPAKGVKPAKDLAFEAAWSTPGADIDLYVAEIDKYGDLTEIDHCGAGVGSSEKVWIPGTEFKAGRKYAVVVDFYRTVNESVKVTALWNGPNTMTTTIPAQADAVAGQNCGQ
jgi:hypothetical protein